MLNNGPAHSLLIIGNGFDLNCQIPSSFEDFFKQVNNFNNFWYLLFSFAFSNDDYGGEIVVEPIKSKDILWMDVESFIKKIMLSKTPKNNFFRSLELRHGVYDYISLFSLLFENRFDRSFYNEHEQIRAIKDFFRCKFQEYDETGDKFDMVDYFYDELVKFEDDFCKYINKISANVSYHNKSKGLFSLLVGGGACDILSFNYTSPKTPENNGFNCNSFNHVHGNVNRGEIIIGYDSSDLFNNIGKRVRLSKLYQKLFSNLESFKLPEKEEVNCIKIYGHSLGDQDYSYFHSIFDYYDISKNDRISLEFCYTPYQDNEKDNEKIRINYVSSVYRLLNKYSKTFNNANDKIDTLANQLLLENRLKIRIISKVSS